MTALATDFYGLNGVQGAAPSNPANVVPGQGPVALGANFSAGLTSDHLPALAAVLLFGLALLLLHARE